MKISELITEKEIRPYKKTILNTQNIDRVLKRFCPVYDVLLHTPIWRGFRNHTEPVLKIEPWAGVRESQNTTNYYTELMDNSPYFKGWPKRSQSLICTTELSHARAYGTPGATYAVFPARGVNIAVCPKSDIWDTLADITLFGGLIAFPDINFYLSELGLSPKYSTMVNQVKSPWFEKNLKEFCEIADIEMIKTKYFLPTILEAMAPINTGFQLLTPEEFIASELGKRELWISGTVIIVEESLLKELINLNSHGGKM